MFRRLEPVHRDLARVTRATASRRVALKRLIHRYGLLMQELGRRPGELRRLVSASGAVFGTLAGESAATSRPRSRGCPARCGPPRARSPRCASSRRLLQSTLESLREPIRELPATNAALTPFFRATTPVLRDQIRPFVRAAAPFTDDLRVAANDLAKATPDLTTSLEETNRFFNMGAYNPGGAEGLGGLSIAAAARPPGGLPVLARLDLAERGLAASTPPTRRDRGPARDDLRRRRPVLQASVIGPVLERRPRPTRPRPAADRRPGDDHPAGQPDRQPARHRVRLLQLQDADAMNKNPPSTGRIAAMVLFTLSVFALLLFLWVSFGGVLPLKAQGYRFKADFPEAALLAKEADVRMAGVNVGKVRSTELGPGGRSTRAEIEIDDRFAPIKIDTRAILRQKSLLGETYVELSPGQPDSEDLPDGGMLHDANVQDTVELDEVFRAFDPRTRRYFQEWLHDAGIASTRRVRVRPERLARQRRAVLQGRRRPAAAARRAGGRAAPGRARHRPHVRRDLARERPAARR